MEYPLEICLSYVFVIVFFSCSEVSGRVSGKVSVLDVFFALVSQVLSFYSLHISFFSPVISRDQCPQREQQTFPQDWEYYAILWSILWRYVCHTCLSLFFSVVLKFPEESLEKFLCWMFFFALVSQVLSFYSLHISFFSPVISRDQYPQREQQTFPQDWEYYAILWSILWRYVCHTCLSLFFSVVLKFPEEYLEKFLCWMFFFALVSQVLSFYSLHISFFSPVISRDQYPQREQQTFPQDLEYYAILWSILWRYVCHTCLSLFFSVVLKFPEESLEKFLCWMFFFCLGQPGPLIL